MDDLEFDSQRSQRRVPAWMVGAGFVVLVISIAWTGIGVNGAASDREAALADKLTKAEARIDQLSSQLVEGNTKLTAELEETRSHLQRAEAVVNEREAHRVALAVERMALQATPGKFIASLGVAIADRGLFNTYSRAIEARLQNTSHFNVTNLRGIVEYRRADGSLVGSSPVTVNGTLLAGQTATLELVAGEVSGGSSRELTRLVAQGLTVLGGE